MGGPLSVLIAISAAIVFYGLGHPAKFCISVVAAIACFLVWRWMVCFAKLSARTRFAAWMQRTGASTEDVERFIKEHPNPQEYNSEDALSVPDWLAKLHMAVTFVAVVMLVWGLIARFW